MGQSSPLIGQVYQERNSDMEQYSDNRRDVNSYGMNKGYVQTGSRTPQDDFNYQRTHPVLQNLTNVQHPNATKDNGKLSDSTSVTSSASESTTPQGDGKQESFLQRATKFFQQQFQLDIKLPSDKTATDGALQQPPIEDGAKTPVAVTTQSTAEPAPSYPKPSPIITQHQKGISPYRQMPLVTRDQLAQQQPRGASTQNYLQPPNHRGHRKISDSRLLSQNQGDSPGDARRRVSAAGRLNKSPVSGESGSSSPNVTRKQRVLPSTVGRHQIGRYLEI